MSAGPLPPNPAELIESQRMRKLIQWGEEHYDRVIIDTPPAAVVADAIPLVPMVSGVVIVVRLGHSHRDAVERLRTQLANVNAPVLGVVLNGSVVAAVSTTTAGTRPSSRRREESAPSPVGTTTSTGFAGAPRGEAASAARLDHAGPPLPGADVEGVLSLELHRDLDAIRDEWTALAERCGNPFATWEWAATWWDHFGRARSLPDHGVPPAGWDARRHYPAVPLQARGATDGSLRGSRRRRRPRADLCQAGCRAGRVRAAADREEGRRWDLLLAERMPKGTLPELLSGRVLQEEASPLLPIDGASWEEFLASCSSNMRGQIRNKRRRLERKHGLGFADRRALACRKRLRHPGAASPRPLGRGGPSPSRGPPSTVTLPRAFERGWLRLWFLEVEGRAVAAWYGFRFGDVEWYYQSGRDPDWDRSSVGLTLLARTLQGAFDDGMSAYAFLRGDEAYKQRFATRDEGLETVALARGPRGRAAISAARAAKRMPPSVRNRVLRTLG